MMRHTRLKHQFVHYIPELLEPGVIYVSVDYATAVHSCCCGCGKEVVTPLAPDGWHLTFDGDTVSLSPSIGNWNFDCRSHYFIERNRVLEAKPWPGMGKDKIKSFPNREATHFEDDKPQSAWSRVKGWMTKKGPGRRSRNS